MLCTNKMYWLFTGLVNDLATVAQAVTLPGTARPAAGIDAYSGGRFREARDEMWASACPLDR